MLNAVKISNFGPISQLEWANLSNINLIIGGNGSGKTFLLKAIYSGLRTLETFRRGNEQRNISDILLEKLIWTFQTEKIGDLVTKGAESNLRMQMTIDGSEFEYSFGRDTAKQIPQIINMVKPIDTNSIFLPAKEVLTLQDVILKSRNIDRVFGFDDTYFDLCVALSMNPVRGKNFKQFSRARGELEDLLGGVVQFDANSARWIFSKGRNKYPLGVTAEGIKKIAILDTLLGNRYIDTRSTVLIDEAESALHPSAISRFLDIIKMLSESGMQFFITTHSYFVVKKLALIAAENNIAIPVISMTEDRVFQSNLRDGMPSNSIIDESIRLYERELEISLK